nr:hypothetical protein [Tanacetum cinerariifolium]
MANQEQNPLQQEQPFVDATQVGFNLEDILINTNNEVSFSIPTCGIYEEVGVNTFRNAIGAHYLSHSSEYVVPLFIDIVRPWFETIEYGETVPAKGTLKKSLLPPRWRLRMALKPNQPEGPPFTYHMLAICSAAKPVVFKALKPSSNAERVPQGTKPRAKPRHKKHLTSLKQPSVSNSEGSPVKKELPSKITTLSREIQELKRHVQGMEIELPGDLNGIPTKL